MESVNTPISQGARKNFNTLLLAASNSDLCLVQCSKADTGEPIAVICAINKHSNGIIEFIPLAKQFDGSPYDEINPPTVDAPKSIGEFPGPTVQGS